MDPNNISANYNLGIIYYNEGVEIVNNMDYSLDLFELNAVQDKIIELFKESLPYMTKAYELNPKRRETLIGLQGIYFSLNDIEKSEAFKQELEALDNEGNTATTPTKQSQESPQDTKLQDEAK
jgi:tetratricopeptide (TPR) repeat protein